MLLIDLNAAEKHPTDNRYAKSKKRIQSSFHDITANLMPHPRMIVARSNNFTYALDQIDEEYIKYVKK